MNVNYYKYNMHLRLNATWNLLIIRMYFKMYYDNHLFHSITLLIYNLESVLKNYFIFNTW